MLYNALQCRTERVRGEEGTYVMHSRKSWDHVCSHPYNARTEHVGWVTPKPSDSMSRRGLLSHALPHESVAIHLQAAPRACSLADGESEVLILGKICARKRTGEYDSAWCPTEMFIVSVEGCSAVCGEFVFGRLAWRRGKRSSCFCSWAPSPIIYFVYLVLVFLFIFACPWTKRDLVISEFEIARAKEAGAVGVTVVLALVGPERCAELAAFCKKAGAYLSSFHVFGFWNLEVRSGFLFLYFDFC